VRAFPCLSTETHAHAELRAPGNRGLHVGHGVSMQVEARAHTDHGDWLKIS
jgi:hypothetical protein